MPRRKKQVKYESALPPKSSASTITDTVATRFFAPNRPWTDLFKPPGLRVATEQQLNETKQKKANVLQELSKHYAFIKQEQDKITQLHTFFTAYEAPKTMHSMDAAILYLSAYTRLNQKKVKKDIDEINKELSQLTQRIDKLEALLRDNLNTQYTGNHSEPLQSPEYK